MEDIIKLFRQSLLDAFDNWLEKNKEAIGEKWYDWFLKKREEAGDCDTAIKIVATSMWMFNMVADCGVLAGIGPDMVNIQGIREGLDEQSTKRLLLVISSCMNLQYLPKDAINQEIPIISAKRFSLKEYIRQTSEGDKDAQ
jgi:hypothetical protein